jgi:competence protein ComEC
VIAFYGLLTIAVCVPFCRVYGNQVISLLVLSLVITWSGCSLGSRGHPHELRMTFLSIGHGTCVVVELPDDRVWIYDAGTFGSNRFAVQEISNFLWSEGITSIEGVMLSHADLDHFNALPGLLRRFPVGQVCTSRFLTENPQPGIRKLLGELQRHRVPVALLHAGDRLPIESPVSMVVRHPAARVKLPDNEASMVLEIQYLGRRILLPGDLEGNGMRSLLSEKPTDCDLVLAPHHGSRHSQPEAFCQWSTPEWIVVSGGRNSLRLEDGSPFADCGARVLITSLHGAVQARIVNGDLTVSSFIPRKS